MTSTLDSLAELLITHAPDPLFLAGGTLHVGDRCQPRPGQDWHPVEAADLVARALTEHIDTCATAPDSPEVEDAWTSTLQEWAYWRLLLAPAAATTGALMQWAGQSAGGRFDTDPNEPARTCCAPCAHPGMGSWAADVDRLVHTHVHEHLTRVADALGTPTTWVALGAHRLLPGREDLKDPLPSAPLTTFHPWAALRHNLSGPGVSVLHLPADLVDLALEHGGVLLEPAHVTAPTWAVVRALLRPALELPYTDDRAARTAHEDIALQQLPQMFAVGHAATH